jgi:hypothetical protein
MSRTATEARAEALLAQMFAAIDREQSTTVMGYCDDARDILDEVAARALRKNASRAYCRTKAINVGVKMLRFALDMSE